MQHPIIMEVCAPRLGSVGDCYDNTLSESFFASLECELLQKRRFQSQAEAKMAVFAYMEARYNPRRRHSSLGRVAPITYERLYRANAA